MKNIVLVSHGSLAEGVKSSLEMIAGKQPNVHTVTLRPDGDNIQFKGDLESKMKTFAGPTIIIADLLGGTPANVSLEKYMNEPNIDIITGLSLPLALECVLGSDRTPIELLASAKEGMVDLKASMTEEQSENKIGSKSTHEDLAKYAEFSGKQNIVNTRIDERLIHGQVAGIWSSTLNTQRIIVANDEAAADDFQKSGLRMAAPKSMRLSVLPVADAANNINSGKYGRQRLFLLFKNPTDVKRFIEAGGKLDRINVGNMSHKVGAREVTKNIYVTDKEQAVFQDIAANGVKVTAQLVPNDPVIDFMKKINK